MARTRTPIHAIRSISLARAEYRLARLRFLRRSRALRAGRAYPETPEGTLLWHETADAFAIALGWRSMLQHLGGLRPRSAS